MITFGSDVADLILQRTLGENTLGLNNSINRMTTGYKVNQAKDNAAGYSIITDLSKKISSMLQVQQNTEDGISLLQTAEGGLEQVQKLLERLRDLATQASNGTYAPDTRDAMQAEADQILEQISQIRESIKYDNQNLYYRDNNVNTPQTKSEDTLSQNCAVLSTVSTALSDVIEGAEAFAGGETRTITIDGVQYTVKNLLSTANDLSYTKDTSTGELTLIASNFEIRGQSDVAHNLIISGQKNYIYGGSKDDILLDASNSRDNKLYGLAGNDTITLNGVAAYGYGGEGNDIITANGGSSRAFGEAGNDTINLTDWFEVDGGAGTNKVTGEINSTMTLVNVDRANAGTLDFAKNETRTVSINGIDYLVTNGGTAQSLVYKISDSGQIEFSTTNGSAITIKGDVNKSHNVELSSSYITPQLTNLLPAAPEPIL